jgi:hypothetical protein
MKRLMMQFIILASFLLTSFTCACYAQTETTETDKSAPPTLTVAAPTKNKSSETSQNQDEEMYKIKPAPDENDSSKIYIPKDLEDSFIELDKMLHPKFIEKFKNGGKEQVNEQHFGLGLWMRNNWGFGVIQDLQNLLKNSALITRTICQA